MPNSDNPVANWDFTINAETIGVDALKGILKESCKKWTFQLEKGEKTGYLHYQGRVSLKTKNRFGIYVKDSRWSVTSNENKANMFYVMKDESRVDGPWTNEDAYVPKQVRDIQLYQWQQQILDDARVWDTRTINILYCPSGNIGKSTLKTYAGANKLARSLPMMESYKDYMRMVMDCPKSRLYLIDFPRSMSKTSCAGFWSAIETIKDGYAYDDRYGFREEYFDCPNMWIFCNTIPDENYLSKDRWKFWVVDHEKTLRPYLADK